MEVIRYMELRGTPREMGEAHGEAWRDEIRDFIARRIDVARDFVERHDPGRGLTREDVSGAGRLLVATHRDYDADIWSELEGIAVGADVGIADLLACNGLTDVRDWLLLRAGSGLRGRERAAPPEAGTDHGGCTAFVTSATVSGGSPLLGQTWDMHPDARHFLLVQRRRPDRGPGALALTTVGCLPLIGINDHGVSVGTNNLVPTDARVGVSYLFTIARAFRERTAESAAAVIESTPRLSGHNFVLADTQASLNIETTARRSMRTRVDSDARGKGVFVHANHYVSVELRPHACTGIELPSSRWREEHLYEGFRAADRPLNPAICWDLLSDATRGEGAVCNEDYDGVYGLAATAATAVVDPAAGVLLACAGGARLGRQERFALDR